MTAASVGVAVLGALAVLQIAVAAGVPWGRLVWGGAHRVLPTRLRIGSALSVLLYGAFAAVLLVRTSVVGAPNGFVTVASWVIFGYSCVGILANAASRSRAERWTMTPVCIVLTAVYLVASLS